MSNPTTIVDGEEMLNTEVIRDYVCDACYGELTERWRDGGFLVSCFDYPEHHGVIRRVSAYYRQRKEERGW